MPRGTCWIRRGAALIAVAAVLGPGGCTGSTGPGGTAALIGDRVDDPHLVGRVAGAGIGESERTLLVRELRVPASGYEAGVALHVGSAPIFVRHADGSLARGELSDLTVGSTIRAWSTGVELRSLPPQWSATYVEVMR